jgi:hypothetical protein
MHRSGRFLLAIVSCTALCAQAQTSPDRAYQVQNSDLDHTTPPPELLTIQSPHDLATPVVPVFPDDSLKIIPDAAPAMNSHFDLNTLGLLGNTATAPTAIGTVPPPTELVGEPQSAPFFSNSNQQIGQDVTFPPILFEGPAVTSRPADQIPVMVIICGLSLAVLSLAVYLLRKAPPPPRTRRKGPFDFLPENPSASTSPLDVWLKK